MPAVEGRWETGRIPVLFVAAEGEVEDETQGLALGAEPSLPAIEPPGSTQPKVGCK